MTQVTQMTQVEKFKKKYPDRIPIIVNRYKDCILPDLEKNKYLVPKDMKINGFIYVIRKKIKLSSEQAMFITINGELCPSNKTLEEIYEYYKNPDGYLYIDYSSENTFG